MDTNAWKALIRTRLADAPLDDDAVDEIAEHAAEVYREQRRSGFSTDEARAAVVAEMTDLPALMRAARAAHRRRIPPAPEPAPPPRARPNI